MKICPKCNFENFQRQDFCERCNCDIVTIKKESFHIDQFIANNANSYTVISVLIALAAFLYDPSFFNQSVSSVLSSQFSTIIVVPLAFSVYLLAKLIVKGWRYLNLNETEVSPDLIRVYIFTVIQLMFILGLLFIIDKTNNMGGFSILVGLVVVPEFLSESQKKTLNAKIILLSALFSLILGLFLLLSISWIYSIVHWDALFVFLFTYGIFICFLSVGEMMGASVYFISEGYIKDTETKDALTKLRERLTFGVPLLIVGLSCMATMSSVFFALFTRALFLIPLPKVGQTPVTHRRSLTPGGSGAGPAPAGAIPVCLGCPRPERPPCDIKQAEECRGFDRVTEQCQFCIRPFLKDIREILPVFLLMDLQRPGGLLPPSDDPVQFHSPHTVTVHPWAGAGG